MVDPVMLAGLAAAGLALNLTPGPDMLFCLSQGLRGGRRAGWAASAGVALGVFVHVMIAGLGLGAIFAASPTLFEAVRWIGVGYLLWLALAALRAQAPEHSRPKAVASAFRSALLINLLNPKVILFVLAFVPQFVVPAAGPIMLQFLIFGLTFATTSFLVNGVVGSLGARAEVWMAARPRYLDWLSSGIFAGLAVRLAVLERT